MFKAELSDSNILKTSFDAISSIVDEVQLQTDSEGVRLNALDRSHITFVHLELKASLFDEFICDMGTGTDWFLHRRLNDYEKMRTLSKKMRCWQKQR